MKKLGLAEPGAVGVSLLQNSLGACGCGVRGTKGGGLQILKETSCLRLGMGKSRGLGLTAWEGGGGGQHLALSLQMCLCQLSWFKINLHPGGGST